MARVRRTQKEPKPPRILASSGFARWRQVRPFWAGALLIFAGLEIGVWPLAPVGLILQTGLGGISAVLFTLFLVTDGLVVWFASQYRTILGLQAAVIGLISVVTTNLGGFFVGALAAMLGGAMAIAWAPPAPLVGGAAEDEAPPAAPTDPDTSGEVDQSQHATPVAPPPYYGEDDVAPDAGGRQDAEPVLEPALSQHASEAYLPPTDLPPTDLPPAGLQPADPQPADAFATLPPPVPVQVTEPPARPRPRHPSPQTRTGEKESEGVRGEAEAGEAREGGHASRIGTLLVLLTLAATTLVGYRQTPASAAPLCIKLLVTCPTSTPTGTTPTATAGATPSTSSNGLLPGPVASLLPGANPGLSLPALSTGSPKAAAASPGAKTAAPMALGQAITAGGTPFLLRIATATLYTPKYLGNVQVPTGKGGTVLAMKLHFDIDVTGVVLTDNSGVPVKVTAVKGSLKDVTYYATKLQLKFAGVPLTFTPALPPSVANLAPFLPATDLIVDTVYFSIGAATLTGIERTAG